MEPRQKFNFSLDPWSVVPSEELMTADDVDFLKINCLLDSYADFCKIG